ncbi:MAG: ABC transporter permease [Butyrivibrio sp.]|nr:ABC transporter permease [Butyrivibrio sp.]
MKKTVTLIIHNLKKAKGQYISFGLIICLTAFIINIALVLAFQTFDAYDSRFGELDTADINFIIPALADDGEILDELAKIDGVSAAERHDGVFVAVTVREFAGSDFDMNTVFYNIDDIRTINRLEVSEYAKKEEGAVYIPLYMKELGGFVWGGSITYSVDGRDYTYPIGGTVSEMQYGNYGTGLIGGYLPSDVYKSFADEHSGNIIAEYSLKIADNADLTKIKNAASDILSGKGIAALSINDRIVGKQTRTMVCTLLIVIFLALAAIILAVSIFLSSFRIRSTIEDEMAQMGVLKAVGYTSRLIICSVVCPYVLTGAVFALCGAALSYAVLPFVASILAIQSGFTYTPVFDGAALLTAVAVLVAAIFLFAYLSAAKIHKSEPMAAIRGSRGSGGTGQNILLAVLSVGIMVLLSFAGTLFYNVSVKPDNFMNTLSEETPSVIFTAQDGKMQQVKELLSEDGRVKLALEYASAPVSYEDGSLTAFVCEDFGKVTNDICYEGRNPANADEAAIGSMLADDYPIGSKIELTSSDKSAVYEVTGYIQSVNNAGKVCALTSGGYERIGGEVNTVNAYLHDEGAEVFIEEYEKAHGSLIASSVNYEKLSENGRRMYSGIVSAAAAVLFVIAVLTVLLVMYVIINSMIGRRRQEFGIYKAVGYTSRQLTLMTAARFLPVVGLSSVLSAAAGLWYLPVINRVILSQIGAVKNYFEISIPILLVIAVAFTAVSFLISVLLAAPIKKITAYSLLRE